MDDLLKVFLAETAECLAECQGDLAKLRQAPTDTAPVDNILRLVRSIRETSGFLGMPGLQVAANAAIDGLEAARASLPGSADRVVAIADESLARMQVVVEGLVADAAAAAPAPAVLATKRPSRKKKPDAEPRPAEDAEEDEAAVGAAAASTAAAPPAVETSDAVAAAPPVPAAPALAAPPAQPAPVEPALPAPVAPDGTVRVSAEMLENLLSTVSRLMAAQTEMMQLLKTKEPAAAPPVVTPVPTVAPPAAARDAAPADAAIPDTATKAAPEPPVAAAQNPAPPSRDAPITADGKVVPLHTRQSAAPRTSPEAAPAAAPKVPPPVAAVPTQRVVLFRAADRMVRAITLDRATRLEEVDVKAIDGSRGLWVMRSGGEIFPLVPFDAAHRLGESGRAPVIVFTFDGQSFGLLVDSVLSVSDAVVTPATTRRAGYLGTAQVDGAAVDVIDPLHYLNEAVQNRFRLGRRNDSKPRPPRPERPAIPDGDDLFVRKPAR
jgi:chemotaxis protein histidine kinase CheA